MPNHDINSPLFRCLIHVIILIYSHVPFPFWKPASPLSLSIFTLHISILHVNRKRGHLCLHNRTFLVILLIGPFRSRDSFSALVTLLSTISLKFLELFTSLGEILSYIIYQPSSLEILEKGEKGQEQ